MIPLLLGSVAFLLPHAVAHVAAPPLRKSGAAFAWGDSNAQLLRLRVRVPVPLLGHFPTQKELLAWLSTAMKQGGWGAIELVMQDPTDKGMFTVLARGRGVLGMSSAFEVVGAEPVEEPERERAARIATDPGLSEEEMWAIGKALAWDTNPKHLAGFAGTFSPHYPVAHCLLAVKAKVLGGELMDLASLATLSDASAWLPNASNVRAMWKTLFSEHAKENSASVRYAEDSGTIRTLREGAERWADANAFPRDMLNGECKRALCMMVENDEANLKAFPMPLLGLAAACLWDGPGLSIVCPASVRAAFPATGDEGFVSSSALQLAMAEMKPELAGIRSRAQVPTILHDVASQADRGNPDAMRARAMVEKAEKAIDRRRWVEWYRQEASA